MNSRSLTRAFTAATVTVISESLCPLSTRRGTLSCTYLLDHPHCFALLHSNLQEDVDRDHWGRPEVPFLFSGFAIMLWSDCIFILRFLRIAGCHGISNSWHIWPRRLIAGLSANANLTEFTEPVPIISRWRKYNMVWILSFSLEDSGVHETKPPSLKSYPADSCAKLRIQAVRTNHPN